MILTPTSVYARAGQQSYDRAHLLMCIEKPLVNKLHLAESIDPSAIHYVFAMIFEDSVTCGETGVHQYITAISFANEFALAGHPHKMTPVKAWMLITLDEYDDLRIRRKNREEPGGFYKNTHAFPEYARLASGVGS